MRISDWSSDVCSSDLRELALEHGGHVGHHVAQGAVLTHGDEGALQRVRPVGAADLEHEALQAGADRCGDGHRAGDPAAAWRQDLHDRAHALPARSEEHTSELQSLMRISYAVFCLQKKKTKIKT